MIDKKEGICETTRSLASSTFELKSQTIIEDRLSLDSLDERSGRANSSVYEKPVPPYSIFTEREQFAMVILLAVSGVWSTLSLSIYYPVLPEVGEKFNITSGEVNASVVTYLVMQGICPTFISTLADYYGRRPCVMGCLMAYCCVCIGISKVQQYWVLAFLRCIQASCVAPLVSISLGVVADIAKPVHRGKFIGLGSGIQLLGQGFGAVLGAAIVEKWEWRGVFDFLAIGGGVMALAVLIFLPETNRALVGNASIIPSGILRKSPMIYLPGLSSRLVNDTLTLAQFQKLDVFSSFKIVLKRDVLLALIPCSFQFTTWTMVLTTLSSTLASQYGFSTMRVGVCYLAPGMGTLVGAVCTGKILDYVYGKHRAQYDAKYNNLKIANPESVPEFDIVRARLEFAIYPSILLIAALLVFGWTIEYKTSIAPFLISAFVISCCAVSFLSAITTLLIDMFPGDGSAATSCMNLARCLVAALFVGVLLRMTNAMGHGWCFTLMAGLCLSTLLLGYLAWRQGHKRNRF